MRTGRKGGECGEAAGKSHGERKMRLKWMFLTQFLACPPGQDQHRESDSRVRVCIEQDRSRVIGDEEAHGGGRRDTDPSLSMYGFVVADVILTEAKGLWGVEDEHFSGGCRGDGVASKPGDHDHEDGQGTAQRASCSRGCAGGMGGPEVGQGVGFEATNQAGSDGRGP